MDNQTTQIFDDALNEQQSRRNAPSLLEACEQALQALECSDAVDGYDWHRRTIKLLEQAIANAKGE